MAAKTGLRYVFLADDFFEGAVFERESNRFFVIVQHPSSKILQSRDFVPIEIVLSVLCEAEDKESGFVRFEENDRAETARFPLPLTGNPLFLNTTTQVCMS
jgi:hypothetical protein